MNTFCPPSSSFNAALLAMDSQPAPVQLSLPAMSLWTIYTLTDNHCAVTKMYTSSANYSKALTETMGEVNYSLQTQWRSPSSSYTLNPLPPKPQMLDAQRLSRRTCNQPFTSNLSCVEWQFFFALCGMIVKNLMCHCLGGRMPACLLNVNSELKLISNYLCL